MSPIRIAAMNGAKMSVRMGKRCMNSSEGRCLQRMCKGMRYRKMCLRAGG
jgi:hypothetical protein